MDGRAEAIDSYLDATKGVVGFKTTTKEIRERKITNNIRYTDKNTDKVFSPLNPQLFNEEDSQAMRNNLISLRSKKEIIENALKIACNKLSCQVAAIFLFSKDGLLTRAGIQGLDKNSKLIKDDWLSEESYQVGESFTGRAARTKKGSKYGKTQVTNNFDQEHLNNRDEYLKQLGKLQCAIAVPLNGQNKTYGVFRVINKIHKNNKDKVISYSRFSDEDLFLVSSLGSAIAAAISNFHRDTQNETLIYLQNSLINSESNSFNYSKFYQKTLDYLVGPETAFKVAILRIKSDDSEEMKVRHVANSDQFEEDRNNQPRILGQGFVEFVSESLRPQIINKISKSGMINKFINSEWIKENNLESFGRFPLIYPNKQEVIGTISLFAGHEYEFHPSIIDFLTNITSSMAVIVQREKKKERINEKFFKLVEQWRSETGFLSSTTEMVIHPAYQQIIGMGENVIPLLLEELEKRSGRWFWALRAITGEDPVPENHRGITREMRKAWIDWGRQKGYIN